MDCVSSADSMFFNNNNLPAGCAGVPNYEKDKKSGCRKEILVHSVDGGNEIFLSTWTLFSV